MWAADRWKDFEIIDCGDGQRFERWGKYKVIRPDPQAVWEKSAAHLWKTSDASYIRSNTGGGYWNENRLPKTWTISYGEMTFNIKPMGFKHMGIFPEQAANWDFISDMIKNAGRHINVLNLFAYTGGASVAAAMTGASVCHVDAAKGMVAMARENMASSGLENAPVRYIVDDCRKFVEREIRRGKRYDAVIMDPPSYGKGPSGEVWKIEDELDGFIKLCANVLSDEPLFFIVNSYTAGLSPSVPGYILGETLKKRYGGKVESAEMGLPVSSTGLLIPCGAATRWIGAR